MKKLKNRLYQGIPLAMYIVAFLFTILTEIINAKLDVKIVLQTSFWLELGTKYVILIIVLMIMLPYFEMKMKGESEYIEIKQRARNINDKIVERRLSNIYIDYTAEEMIKEERQFFENKLNECGKIDLSYLEKECTIEFIKQQFIEKKLHKDQFKLLMKIKKGQLKFAKLNGMEIKYVGEYNVDEKNKYKNQNSKITFVEMTTQMVMLFVVNILSTILMQSLFNGDVSWKGEFPEILLSIITTLMNYLTAVIFASSVARKLVNENKRFTEQVINFSSNFLEKIDTKMYVPKVSESVKEQLELFNQPKVEDDVLELTQEEIDLIIKNRKGTE